MKSNSRAACIEVAGPSSVAPLFRLVSKEGGWGLAEDQSGCLFGAAKDDQLERFIAALEAQARPQGLARRDGFWRTTITVFSHRDPSLAEASELVRCGEIGADGHQFGSRIEARAAPSILYDDDGQ